MDIRRSVMLPTPAVWPTDRLAELREHIAQQNGDSIATMAGSYGPESPIKRDGELVTVQQALRLLDGWIAGKLESGWNRF